MTPDSPLLVAARVKDPGKWLDAVVEACTRFQINTPKRIAAFLAQTAHESGGYERLEEDLRYSAKSMAGCWPNRFAELGPDKKPKKDDKGFNIPNKFALALDKKPEMLANVVYSNRMGNGTIESGEGWKYRGRGLKQLTGKDNYTRCGKSLGIDLVEKPELLLTPQYAALSAGWFWDSNRLGDFADKDDFVGMTKKINGGTIGLADREARYKSVLSVLS